jgi:hypothetical protein
VREAVEIVLTHNGTWNHVLDRYEADDRARRSSPEPVRPLGEELIALAREVVRIEAAAGGSARVAARRRLRAARSRRWPRAAAR